MPVDQYAQGFTDGIHYSLAVVFMLAMMAVCLIILREIAQRLWHS